MKWNQALKDYVHFLKIERGLSDNTVNNYVLDVKKLITYIVMFAYLFWGHISAVNASQRFERVGLWRVVGCRNSHRWGQFGVPVDAGHLQQRAAFGHGQPGRSD